MGAGASAHGLPENPETIVAMDELVAHMLTSYGFSFSRVVEVCRDVVPDANGKLSHDDFETVHERMVFFTPVSEKIAESKAVLFTFKGDLDAFGNAIPNNAEGKMFITTASGERLELGMLQRVSGNNFAGFSSSSKPSQQIMGSRAQTMPLKLEGNVPVARPLSERIWILGQTLFSKQGDKTAVPGTHELALISGVLRSGGMSMDCQIETRLGLSWLHCGKLKETHDLIGREVNESAMSPELVQAFLPAKEADKRPGRWLLPKTALGLGTLAMARDRGWRWDDIARACTLWLDDPFSRSLLSNPSLDPPGSSSSGHNLTGTSGLNRPPCLPPCLLPSALRS